MEAVVRSNVWLISIAHHESTERFVEILWNACDKADRAGVIRMLSAKGSLVSKGFQHFPLGFQTDALFCRTLCELRIQSTEDHAVVSKSISTVGYF